MAPEGPRTILRRLSKSTASLRLTRSSRRANMVAKAPTNNTPLVYIHNQEPTVLRRQHMGPRTHRVPATVLRRNQ